MRLSLLIFLAYWPTLFVKLLLTWLAIALPCPDSVCVIQRLPGQVEPGRPGDLQLSCQLNWRDQWRDSGLPGNLQLLCQLQWRDRTGLSRQWFRWPRTACFLKPLARQSVVAPIPVARQQGLSRQRLQKTGRSGPREPLARRPSPIAPL